MGTAVCDFTPEMNEALQKFEKCLGKPFRITCGRDSHALTDPHMKGQAIDIGHRNNPWLTRDQVVKCFNQAFPANSYGQKEYNQDYPPNYPPGQPEYNQDSPGDFHYHFQYTPGLGGQTGFSPIIHPHGH